MNEAIKARWVEALRSGKFEQGRFKLSADGKFCCLGVLCELAVEDGVIEKEETVPIGGSADQRIAVYAGFDTALPWQVVKWAGLSRRDALVRDKGEPMTLAQANDHRDKTFDDIATLIEENL